MKARRTICLCALLLAACGASSPPPRSAEPATPKRTAIAPAPAANAEAPQVPPPVPVAKADAPAKPAAAPKAPPKPAPEPPKAAAARPAPEPPKVAAARPAPESPKVAAPKSAPAPAPAAAAPAPRPSLDLKSLEQRLKDSDAIGVLTKLSLKNQVDDLVARFRQFHAGTRPPTLAELRPAFELLLMKVMSLLQDKDTRLANDIHDSRESIWAVLADRDQFARYT